MREESIFAAALDRSHSERAAFLDEACGDDPTLRNLVESLLRSHEEAHQGFLKNPAAEDITFTRNDRICEGPGSVIGPYKLLEEIGSGGFGVVYLAEQREPVQRKVALKIIKPGMDSAEVIARFESERQALAIMDHPHIARVLDGGSTETGRPYFVMELVRGVPITEYCDQQRLTPGGRLALFISVCHAVQHAHQKGIIHRDIKPSNVLVALHDGTPVPKVIDFGVAKAIHQRLTEKTLFTRHGQILGTPHYMSPEQAAMGDLDVDTRSDIYSLGVLLYELLTGTTPLDRNRLRAAAFAEVQRMIREEEPLRPSLRISSSGDLLPSIAANRHVEPRKLGKLLRGELDWIVMKALEKDRQRRYDTADGFAADVQRYLDGEPVEASPPSAIYRLRKLAKRHRGVLVTATAFVVLLLAAAAISTVLAFKATRAEQLAADRLIETQRERDSAQYVLSYLVDALRSPDPDQDGYKVTVAEVLDQAVEQLATDFVDNPRVRLSLLNAIGETYLGLGLPYKARSVYQQAVQTSETSSGDDELETVDVLTGLGSSERACGNYRQAIVLQTQALAKSRDLLGDEHRKTIDIMHSLGAANWSAGDYEQAGQQFQHVIKHYRQLLGHLHQDTLRAQANLAAVYYDAGRWQEALSLHQQVLEMRSETLGENHRDTLLSMAQVGHFMRKVGRWQEATEIHKKAWLGTRELLGENNPNTWTRRWDLAMSHVEAGHYQEGITIHHEVLAARQQILAEDHPDIMQSMNGLANAYVQAGQVEQAVDLYERSLAARRLKLGENHHATLESMSNLANAYAASGRLYEALELQKDVLRRMRARLDENHPKVLTVLNNLAVTHSMLAQYDTAIELSERVVTELEAQLGMDHPETLTTRNNLAAAYKSAGQLDLAIQQYVGTHKTQSERIGPDHPMTLLTLSNLANAYLTAGQLDKAIATYREVLVGFRAKLGDLHPSSADTFRFLANAILMAGDVEQALAVCEEGVPLLNTVFGADHDKTLETTTYLGFCYFRKDRFTEAADQFEKAYRGYSARLGPEDPQSISALYNFGYNTYRAENVEKALPLLKQAAQLILADWNDADVSSSTFQMSNIVRILDSAGDADGALTHLNRTTELVRSSGPEFSADLASLLASLNLMQLQREQYVEAETSARECLALREQTIPDDWRYFNTKVALGRALLGQQKFVEAEPWLIDGMQGMLAREASIPQVARIRLTEGAEAIVQLFERSEQPEKQAAWRDKLKDLLAAGM